MILKHYKLEKKYRKFIKAFSIALKCSEEFLSYADELYEFFSERDNFDEDLYLQNLVKIYKCKCVMKNSMEFIKDLSFKDFIKNKDDENIINMKTYFLEKYIKENDDIYVDSSFNISDVFKKKD